MNKQKTQRRSFLLGMSALLVGASVPSLLKRKKTERARKPEPVKFPCVVRKEPQAIERSRII